MRSTKNAYMSLAAITVVMLLSGALVVPSSNAYAISSNGKGKSNDNSIYSSLLLLIQSLQQEIKQDHKELKGANTTTKNEIKQEIKQDKSELKDTRKQLKDQKEDNSKDKDKCKPNKNGKYNKDCTEDHGGN